MEELEEQQASFPWLRVFIIAYTIAIFLSLVGVVLGAINFAAGPVHYSGVILVLWFLMDIVVLVGIVLNLGYYAIEIGNSPEKDAGSLAGVYIFFVGGAVAWASIALLVGKHFGWFSACELAALVVCGVIDVILAQRGK